MRASNHSYGTPCGWGEPSYPDKLRQWHGDISLAAGQNPPQDYKFGSYNAGAQAADITARMQPYHLIVVAAGNDRGDKPKGGTIAYLMKNGERVGDNSGWDAWFLAKKLFGTVEVDVYVSVELNKYVLKTSFADANWGTDKQTGGNIDGDGFSNQEDDDVDGDGLKNGPDGPDTDNDGDGTLNADENMTPVNGVPLVGVLFSDAEVFDLPGLDLFEDDGNYWFGADTLPVRWTRNSGHGKAKLSYGGGVLGRCRGSSVWDQG